MPATREKSLKTLICLVCLLLSAANLSAQETSAESVHWAYSSYFGSGWYQTSDRDVFVLRTTPRWELREPSLTEDGVRSIGIELCFSLTAGLDRFDLDDISEVVDPENLASLSAIPGVNITIPINERWSLRPFASFGWGTILDGSESAWTYWTGINSQYTFNRGKLDWALVNSIAYVGYSPSEGRSESFLPLMAGLEFTYPLGKKKLDGKQLMLGWHGMYTRYKEDLDFALDDLLTSQITDQWEFGLSLRKQDSRIKIWWFSFDRLGLAYRFSSSGDLKGISFVFRSVFER